MRRIVVVGAGAAGTMAAVWAAASGAETLLIEGTTDGGRKILISGGGRCNILPARLDPSRFVTDSSPTAVRHILRGWPLADQVRFFEQDVGVPLVEEPESAKLFPASNRARDVRDGLLALAQRRGVMFAPGRPATAVTPCRAGWRVERDGADPVPCDAVVLATGGLSVPQTGSDGLGLRIARQLGHTVNPTYAALTPIRADPSPFAALAGVSLPVTVTARSAARTATASGGFLFTHHGYSGPSVLDVSHVIVRALEAEAEFGATAFRANGQAVELRVRWCPLGDAEWEAALRPAATRTLAAALRRHLPERLAFALADHAGIDPSRPLSQLRREERVRVIDTLVRAVLPWSGHEGYKKAEVTGGGVSLNEINTGTMESRRHRGLFLCGEMLDAFGPIGGYNFLWAWVTGRAAGLGAAPA